MSWAEIVTYTHTVRQPFNGSQSPDDARTAAIAKAKREVLEKAGTYLDTVKIVRDRQLVQNQITALSAAVLQAEIISQKNYAQGETFGIEIEAKVSVDTATLEARINNFLKDQSALARAERLELREKELLAKVKDLQEKSVPLDQVKKNNGKTEQQRGKLASEFAEVSKKLTAVEANRKALALWDRVKFTNPEKALAYLSEAIRKDDHFAEAFNNRGIAYADLGQWQQSIKDYDRAIKLEPRFSDALNNRGEAYAHLGEMQKAIQDFDQAIKLNPSSAAFYFNRGTGYANLGQFQPACRDLDKAIELDPKDVSVRTSRGIVLFKSELYRKAINDFDQVLDIQANDAKAYKYRGLCYLMLGEQKRFCSDLESACKFGDCESLGKVRNDGLCKE
jgi:tetratricopeptide (TPR) repeat protein